MGLQPCTARVVRNGQERDLPIEPVVTGDVLLIRPGEKVPVDGVVLDGQSVNGSGLLQIEATRVGRAPWVVHALTAYCVPRSWWPWLGTAKAAGAAGLLVGLVVPRWSDLAGRAVRGDQGDDAGSGRLASEEAELNAVDVVVAAAVHHDLVPAKAGDPAEVGVPDHRSVRLPAQQLLARDQQAAIE
jgi:hypothetical protein